MRIAKQFFSKLTSQISEEDVPCVSYSGNYKNWAEAKNECNGYDAANILEKTHKTCSLLRDKKIAGEQDSMVFDNPQVSYPLLTALYYVYSKLGKINVYDIGGSLGSSYFQLQHLFSKEYLSAWHIIEQQHYIEIGNRQYADNLLSFLPTLPDKLESNSIILLSSVLQFIEEPYKLLQDLMSRSAPFIIIDKTPFSTDNNNHLCIQTVRPPIYNASYPTWHLSKKETLQCLSGYKLIDAFDAHPGVVNTGEHFTSTYKGFFLKK